MGESNSELDLNKPFLHTRNHVHPKLEVEYEVLEDNVSNFGGNTIKGRCLSLESETGASSSLKDQHEGETKVISHFEDMKKDEDNYEVLFRRRIDLNKLLIDVGSVDANWSREMFIVDMIKLLLPEFF